MLPPPSLKVGMNDWKCLSTPNLSELHQKRVHVELGFSRKLLNRLPTSFQALKALKERRESSPKFLLMILAKTSNQKLKKKLNVNLMLNWTKFPNWVGSKTSGWTLLRRVTGLCSRGLWICGMMRRRIWSTRGSGSMTSCPRGLWTRLKTSWRASISWSKALKRTLTRSWTKSLRKWNKSSAKSLPISSWQCEKTLRSMQTHSCANKLLAGPVTPGLNAATLSRLQSALGLKVWSRASKGPQFRSLHNNHLYRNKSQ